MSGHHDDSRLVGWQIGRQHDGRFVLDFGGIGEVTFPDHDELTVWIANVLQQAGQQEQAARAKAAGR